MLRQIETGQIGQIVVYSIDQLTRKLIDLQKLLALFEQHQGFYRPIFVYLEAL